MHSLAEQGELKETSGGDSLLLSIIIPAKNEAAMIAKCLDAISGLQLARTDYEVIVVDNGSTDQTVRIAEAYKPELQVHTLHKTGGFISAVRNAGAKVARGEVLLFLDADCLLRPDWATYALPALLDRRVGAIGGPLVPVPGSSWVVRSWFESDVLLKVGEVSYLGSAALAIRRDVFQNIGGFNEQLETNEDFELCLRARRAGLRIESRPELTVTHLRTPQTVKEFFVRERWHGTHVFRVFLENLRELANVKAVGFGFFTLLCLTGMAVGACLAVLGDGFSLLAGSTVAFVTVCLILSIRMLRRHRSERTLRLFACLLVLHVVYGFARASALLRPRTYVRRTPSAVVSVETQSAAAAKPPNGG